MPPTLDRSVRVTGELPEAIPAHLTVLIIASKSTDDLGRLTSKVNEVNEQSKSAGGSPWIELKVLDKYRGSELTDKHCLVIKMIAIDNTRAQLVKAEARAKDVPFPDLFYRTSEMVNKVIPFLTEHRTATAKAAVPPSHGNGKHAATNASVATTNSRSTTPAPPSLTVSQVVLEPGRQTNGTNGKSHGLSEDEREEMETSSGSTTPAPAPSDAFSALEKFKASIEEVQLAVLEVSQREEGQRAEIERLTGELTAARAAADKATDENAGLTATNLGLTKDVKTLEVTVEQLRGRVDQLSRADAELTTARQKVKELESEVRKLRPELVEALAKLSKAETARQAAVAETEALRKAFQGLDDLVAMVKGAKP